MSRTTLLLSLSAIGALSLTVVRAQSPATQPGRNLKYERVATTTEPGVSQWPGSTRRWALVIGVDHYSDAQIGPLFGSSNDATALANTLVQYAGFPRDQVILLASNQPEERRPTLGNILTRLSNLARLVPKDGLLLLSFAGHGIERNDEAFLLPADARMSDNVRVLQATALGVRALKEWIREMGVRQVVMLLDACRNDPTAGRATTPNLMSDAFRRSFAMDEVNRDVEAFAVLHATKVGQRAYEYSEMRQGYFTWAVVEGLKGKAADGNGQVTLASLERYVQETVPRRISIDLGPDKDQRPFAEIRGYKAGELVIATAKAAGADTVPPFMAATEASLVAQRQEWDRLSQARDVAALETFRRTYPDGPYATEAGRRIEAVEWEALQRAKDAAALRGFLTRHPRGVMAEQARRELEMMDAAAIDHQLVRKVLQSYQQAFTEEDVDRIRALWPGLGRRDLGRIEEFFRIARSVSLELRPSAEPKLQAQSAAVTCRRVLKFTDERGTQRPVEDSVTVRLLKQGGAWVIESIQ